MIFKGFKGSKVQMFKGSMFKGSMFNVQIVQIVQWFNIQYSVFDIQYSKVRYSYVQGFKCSRGQRFNVQEYMGFRILEFGIWVLEFGTCILGLCRPVAPRLVAPHKIRTCDLGLGTYMPTVAGYPGIYLAQSPRRPSPCHPS